MAIKRKAVVKSESALFKRNRGATSKKIELEEKDVPMEEEEVDAAGDEMQEEEEEQETPEELLARQEKELVAARTKDLKSMYIDALKELAVSKGLEVSKKDEIIKAVLSCEAAERAKAREHEAKLRGVVATKKQELEGLPVEQLRKLCVQKGITGTLSKTARVEQLLKHWQEDDGVDKALAKMAQDAREGELRAMDNLKLQRVCERAGVNPFVKEVVVDRIVRCEAAQGKFAPPVVPKEEEEQEPASKGSMVDAILANEVLRKKEKERKQQQEEAAAKKVKDLKAMSLDDLKKALAKKGQANAGKKDELVQALFAIHMQEEATAEKKNKLQSMGIDQLKKLAMSWSIPADKKADKKDKLIELLLDAEAKVRQAVLVHESKLQEVVAVKKEELDAKAANELKDLCVNKGLKAGVGKEDRVQRLLEEARTSGELDQVVAVRSQEARTSELLANEMPALLKLSKEVDADPFVADVMVERIMSYELAFGKTAVEPAAKKAKK